MGVQKIKHVADLAQWRERILACRSSGLPVQEWCAREKINVKTYYRWERLYMVEAENSLLQVRDDNGIQFVQVEPALLPLALEQTNDRCSSQLTGAEPVAPPICVRYGQISVELPASTNLSVLAALVKALSQP